jgi:hypothetical protein
MAVTLSSVGKSTARRRISGTCQFLIRTAPAMSQTLSTVAPTPCGLIGGSLLGGNTSAIAEMGEEGEAEEPR